ncbi:MAG: DUF499 domain-containing protein [Corynebacterium provencense]|jgi:hypothetical protein|uniref:DUF499 domain-containing protein n=1 Tax=Corynebacterium provencense TaxID=1737425 RepID=UPI002989FEF4|nr:DUF499 domain-containing protein [Corynebacterium provencense]
MAQSNRDRINAGFEILADSLNRFLTRIVHIDDNSSWIDILELTDNQRPGSRGRQEYSAEDPQCALRFITEGTTNKFRPGWRPLSEKLTRSEEALASELRETRNRWAHNSKFTDDDAYRALDTMLRLATAMKDTEATKKLTAQRNGVRILLDRKEEDDTNRSAKINIAGEGLQPWREIVTPHPDVANGTFNASGFAADLRTVAGLTGNNRMASSGRHAASDATTAPQSTVSSGAEYTDPQLFFERTYLTEGLKDLLGKALGRLSGDENASPVINLQTNFGGGKTHSMLAVWHLFGGLDTDRLPQDMQDLLDGAEIPTGVRRVALVGTDLVPSGGMNKPDGTIVNTIWGELAWQLGGAEGYELVRDADQTGTNPGGKIRDLLATYGPAVILIDEWVAYARQLVNRTGMAGGDLSTQQTFAQTLAEAVAATPRCMLLVSIPASAEMKPGEYVSDMVDDEEIGGANGLEALTALLQIINRQAEQWHPAGANESFEIVRRRIFQEVSDEDREKIRLIAATVRTFYSRYDTSFPADASRPDYQSKIERCYPIHPELFDRLYQDWSTLPRFQRTRGVLRLMSTIVSELWRSGNNSPLILPADVPLAESAVANELTQYLDDNWKAIIAHDVDGAVPQNIDAGSSLFGPRRVASRLARTVFVGAAPRSRGTGIESSYINLGTALPGDKIGNFRSALDTLANKSTYFYENSGRYWFDTARNITSTVRERAEALTPEDINVEISSRLRTLTDAWNRKNRNSVKVINSPASTGDILDEEGLRLVIVPSAYPVASSNDLGAADSWTRSAVSNSGLKPRTNKNTLVFLAADARRIGELGDSVRQFLAWQSVKEDAKELDLTVSTITQATSNVARWNQAVDDRLADSYQWVIEPVESTEAEKGFVDLDHQAIHGGNEVIQRAVDKLQTLGAFVTQQAPTLIANSLLQYTSNRWMEQGFYSLGELWDMYPKYLYMQRVLGRGVIEEGLRSAGEGTFNLGDRPFAFADSVTGSGEDAVFTNLRWPDIDSGIQGGALPDSLLIVHPDAARAQFQREEAERREREAAEAAKQVRETGNDDGTAGGTGGIDPVPPIPPLPPVLPPVEAKKTRFAATFHLPVSGGLARYSMIDDEILHHLKTLESSSGSVTITLDVEATAPAGFDDQTRTMIDGSLAEMKDAEGWFE